jgi:hypothetical protein
LNLIGGGTVSERDKLDYFINHNGQLGNLDKAMEKIDQYEDSSGYLTKSLKKL